MVKFTQLQKACFVAGTSDWLTALPIVSRGFCLDDELIRVPVDPRWSCASHMFSVVNHSLVPAWLLHVFVCKHAPCRSIHAASDTQRLFSRAFSSAIIPTTKEAPRLSRSGIGNLWYGMWQSWRRWKSRRPELRSFLADRYNAIVTMCRLSVIYACIVTKYLKRGSIFTRR